MARQAGLDLVEQEETLANGEHIEQSNGQTKEHNIKTTNGIKHTNGEHDGNRSNTTKSKETHEFNGTNGVNNVNSTGEPEKNGVRLKKQEHLDLPVSLHSSNILGLSQETDSDAESIRWKKSNFH